MKDNYTSSVYKNPVSKKGKDVISWRLAFRYKDKNDGDAIKSHTPRFDTQKEANAYRDKLIADYNSNAGMFAPPAPKPEPVKEVWTFRRFAEKYWNEKHLTFAESSRPNRKSEINGLVEYFKDTPLPEIDLMAVDDFKRYITDKPVRVKIKVKSEERVLNPETKRRRYVYTKKIRETTRTSSCVNHFLVRLRAMLQIAEDYELMKLPKFRGLIETANDNKRDKTISFAELDNLVAGVSAEAAHLKILLIGLFESGARLSELKAVQRKDISFEYKTAFVLNSKRRAHKKKTYRVVYFSDYLRQALIDAGVENLKDDEFVFSQTDPKNPYARAKRVSGIDPDFTMKDLRHCLPTNLGMCGIDEMIIERQIGHNVKGLLKTVYMNLKADYMVAEMQKYEEFSKRERAKLQKAVAAGG